MALYPKIDSPCPYRDNLAAILDGDMCRLCKRQVFDLTAMADAERVSFFANCETEEVCVSYKIPLRLAAAALAASVMALPAAAAPTEDVSVSADETVTADIEDEEVIVMGGGIRMPREVVFVDEKADADIPELPTVEESAPATPPTAPKP